MPRICTCFPMDAWSVAKQYRQSSSAYCLNVYEIGWTETLFFSCLNCKGLGMQMRRVELSTSPSVHIQLVFKISLHKLGLQVIFLRTEFDWLENDHECLGLYLFK